MFLLLIVSMPRIAGKDLVISDGIKIRKGSQVAVSLRTSWDPKLYEDPYKFDPYRFVKRSQNQKNNASSYFVCASPEHLCFGYGRHACPGRFFASNEEKILLCHVLLKYDVKLADGCNPATINRGYANDVDITTKLMVRRRKEEINLEELAGASV
jgi:cytochrome P450